MSGTSTVKLPPPLPSLKLEKSASIPTRHIPYLPPQAPPQLPQSPTVQRFEKRWRAEDIGYLDGTPNQEVSSFMDRIQTTLDSAGVRSHPDSHSHPSQRCHFWAAPLGTDWHHTIRSWWYAIHWCIHGGTRLLRNQGIQQTSHFMGWKTLNILGEIRQWTETQLIWFRKSSCWPKVSLSTPLWNNLNAAFDYFERCLQRDLNPPYGNDLYCYIKQAQL